MVIKIYKLAVFQRLYFLFVLQRQPSKTYYGQTGCVGTDLNRNWGYRFDDKEGYDANDDWATIGQTDCACDTIFHGGRAFSAPETNNVRNFILKHKDNIKFFNSLHSFGQLVIIPWGYTETPPPHADELLVFARKVFQNSHISLLFGVTIIRIYFSMPQIDL